MSWTRLTLQVRTPLFGGDDPRQLDGCPVRVPSIRGALRLWFRAVAAGHGVSELGELWKAEEAVFGSTSTPSAIRLRVPSPPTMSGRHSRPEWAISERHAKRDGFDGAQYLLGQGLWDYKRGLRRGYVKEGDSFDLDVRFTEAPQVNARFLLALWAWLTYGGLGARTRRGFGQLVCTDVRGDLPCGWMLSDLQPPDDVAGWQSLARCAVPDSLLGKGALGWDGLLPLPSEDEKDDTIGPPPEFPALAPRWWAGCVLDDEGDSLGAVLHLAGLRWRRFRAADGSDYVEDGADYLPTEDKPTPSTRSPEWINVINNNDSRYPLAALGLPVGYFSQSHGSATVTPHLGGKPLRRASPVWLRPVRGRDGRWSVFTQVFFARLLPAETKLRIEAKGRAPRAVDSPPEQDVMEVLNRWSIGYPRLPDGYFPRR